MGRRAEQGQSWRGGEVMMPPWKKRWALYVSHLGSYMRRWIFKHPWGTVRIHNVMRSDEGRDMHDHPFDFTSLILWGGYIEHRPGCLCQETFLNLPPGHHASPCRFYGPGSVVRRSAEDLHRLELADGSTWTLVFTGPYRRKWGFQTTKGWVAYDLYRGLEQ